MKRTARRPAKAFRYQVPTCDDIAAELRALIAGHKTREEVAEWAMEYITYDDAEIYPEVTDAAVWRALDQLGGADLPSTDRPYLHDQEDFKEWLHELLQHQNHQMDSGESLEHEDEP